MTDLHLAFLMGPMITVATEFDNAADINGQQYLQCQPVINFGIDRLKF